MNETPRLGIERDAMPHTHRHTHILCSFKVYLHLAKANAKLSVIFAVSQFKCSMRLSVSEEGSFALNKCKPEIFFHHLRHHSLKRSTLKFLKKLFKFTSLSCSHSFNVNSSLHTISKV